MAEIETFEMNVEDFSASPLKDADASSPGITQLPADRAKPDNKSDDHGYVLETILLNHLKVLWSCIRFLVSHWKAIASVLLTIIVVVIYIGIRDFDKCNKWLTQNDLPVMPSLEELNIMVGYTFFVYFTGGFVIFILGLAAWCSIDWKRMVSTETRRFPLDRIVLAGYFNSWGSDILVLAPRHVKHDQGRQDLPSPIPLHLWHIEQLAAFAERHRDNDILAFYIFQTSYYVAYYYFACAQYFFPAKYEYSILHDQVVLFITGLVVVIAGLALLIGKIFDWVMRDSNDVKKIRDI
ncbi:hypothetical protein FOVG_15214 [Fusarium oxysporum f. sp. pisi HDV247]|uniref:Uncharacterized protein n=1 Tax=Fusarium oxysporum f. sp. pisi HDV247 TaxID=1080344 RepID=W9NL61_FUSOX|nr:hypothetical protein FOVG_15214 [Fusarium oxysporum f. sp. pisi HDV247]